MAQAQALQQNNYQKIWQDHKLNPISILESLQFEEEFALCNSTERRKFPAIVTLSKREWCYVRRRSSPVRAVVLAVQIRSDTILVTSHARLAGNYR